MGGGTIKNEQKKIEALKLQSSTLGSVLPAVFGVVRVPGNMLWFGDFKAIKHKKTQSAGKGGGTTTKTITYTYTADVAVALCEGPILGIPRVWKGKDLYSGGIAPSQVVTAIETYAVPGGGGAKTLTNAATWRVTVAVYYTGTLDVGDGNLTGPIYLAEGVDYTVAAGVYTFGAAWAGKTVSIEYQYITGSLSQAALARLQFSQFSGAVGQATWSNLTTNFPSQAIPYSGIAYVAANNYQLDGEATVPNHTFEVQGRLAYHLGSSVIDADPAMVTLAMLTEARYGALFPAGRLNFALWSKYCRSAGILMSPAFTDQIAGAELLRSMGDLTNTAAVWSAGALKMIPFGDTALTGNGATYTPNVTPLYDLDDTDFLPGSGGGEPIAVTPRATRDAKNHVRLEFLDRAQDYNVSIAEAKDQADIDTAGLRSGDVIQAHWITDKAIATKAAQLILQRSLYIRNEYEFRLPWTFALLEPMDLVTLTDPGLGLSLAAVRILEIEESEDGELAVRAEEFPAGVASASTYGAQGASGYNATFNADPGNVSAPMIFEAPGDLTQTGLEVYAAVVGAGANWGGCTVWVSLDGTSYSQKGILYGGATYGALTGAISAGNLPVSILADDLSSFSSTDASALTSLCYIGGSSPEYLAYQTAALTGALAYTLSGLVRGAYGTSGAATHATSDPFVFLGDGLAKSGPLDLGMVGKTVYFKFTSFNVYGNAEQDLADVTAYTYTITGAHVGVVTPTGLTITPKQGGLLITIGTSGGLVSPDAVFEVYEHTAATPFASASLAWAGSGNVLFLPRDTSGRFYWVRARRGSLVSGTYPASNGLVGVPLGQAPEDADATSKWRICTDAEFLKDFGAATQGWYPNSLASYSYTGGLIGGYATLSPNGSTDAYITSYKYSQPTDALIGTWPITVNVRWRVNTALTGSNKRLKVALLVAYDLGGTLSYSTVDSLNMDLSAAVVGTWYQSTAQLLWIRSGNEQFYNGAPVAPIPRIRLSLAAADVSAGTLDIDYVDATFGTTTSKSLGGAAIGGATAAADLTSSGAVTHTYTGGSGTETVPAGKTSVRIRVRGGGQAGSRDADGGEPGGGGGGGFCERTIAVVAGNTLSYSVGASKLGRSTDGVGATGNASSVTGTVSGGSVSMTANGGAAGAGGTATGGTTNTTGGAGGSPAGGAGGGTGGGAGGVTNGQSGTAPGGGGAGAIGGTSGTGARGEVEFYYA
jgi:hypothetical protein